MLPLWDKIDRILGDLLTFDAGEFDINVKNAMIKKERLI